MAQAILTIDLNAICKNWQALDALSATEVETSAVVKANGYGLGAVKVAKSLYQTGVRSFFVALAEEGAEIRPHLKNDAKIYVFSGYMDGDHIYYNRNQMIPLLNSPEQIKCWKTDFPNGIYGLQIDTGMNRLGIEAKALQSLPPLKPCLIISHLACSDKQNDPFNHIQLKNFHDITAPYKNTQKSLSATGGILLGPEFHFDMTRPGIGLYGGAPFHDALATIQLELPIIQTRSVKTGEYVGYSNKWQAKCESVIATVASGYADGLIRAMGDKISLFDGDIKCPAVGAISMDLITVDITDLAHTPKALSILNQIQTIDDLALAANTIGYEILTSLDDRYQRDYIG